MFWLVGYLLRDDYARWLKGVRRKPRTRLLFSCSIRSRKKHGGFASWSQKARIWPCLRRIYHRKGWTRFGWTHPADPYTLFSRFCINHAKKCHNFPLSKHFDRGKLTPWSLQCQVPKFALAMDAYQSLPTDSKPSVITSSLNNSLTWHNQQWLVSLSWL